MKVRRINRPTEEYAQCSRPKEALSEQPWKGYRERRAAGNGKSVDTCMREAQWEIDGDKFCTQHAGMIALEELEGK